MALGRNEVMRLVDLGGSSTVKTEILDLITVRNVS